MFAMEFLFDIILIKTKLYSSFLVILMKEKKKNYEDFNCGTKTAIKHNQWSISGKKKIIFQIVLYEQKIYIQIYLPFSEHLTIRI